MATVLIHIAMGPTGSIIEGEFRAFFSTSSSLTVPAIEIQLW